MRKRKCPFCGGVKIKPLEVLGLCPLNIWIEMVCYDCHRAWDRGSKTDKKSKEPYNKGRRK